MADPMSVETADRLMLPAEAAAEPARDGHSRLAVTSRRAFVLMTLAALGGCATTGSTTRLPKPVWRDDDTSYARRSGYEPLETEPSTAPDYTASTATTTSNGVISRARWAAGVPVYPLMNRMLPIRYITIHHDGMNAFEGTTTGSAADRLERIRRGHRERGWGDIGYHYAVDRAGNVWEARPLGYQGAHVKDYNEGNIGIVTLGNFEQQYPTEAQVAGVARHVNTLIRQYRVPLANVRTHREWAATLCPGRYMQPRINSLRHSSALG